MNIDSFREQLKEQRIKGDTKQFYNDRICRNVHDLIADIIIVDDKDVSLLLAALTLDQMIYWMRRHGIPKETIKLTLDKAYKDYGI